MSIPDDNLERTPRVLAICGGGNAGHALSVVASQTFDGDVRWLVGSNDKATMLRARSADGALESSGVIVGRADRLRVVSNDPRDVIPGADVVIIAVPAYAHGIVVSQIAPHLDETVLIGCTPSRGGFEFEAAALIGGVGAGGTRTIFGLQTLPWSTRVVEPGAHVNFGAVKESVVMATIPSRAATGIAEMLTRLFGMQIVPTSSFLSLTLGNPGQHIHPGLMHGHFASWQGETFAEDEVPMFYADATPEVSASVVGLSDDTLAVARAVEAASEGRLDLSGVTSVHEWLVASYSDRTGDTSTVSSCFQTGPLLHRKAPMKQAADGRLEPEFQYRYLTEDVPYGLVVTKAIAELAGVATPTVDAVIAWSESVVGVSYVVDGSVRGPDAKTLPIPQNHGLRSLGDLIDWYAETASTIGSAATALS